MEETTEKLDGKLFSDMLRAGAMNLSVHAEAINNLNVFPIPDGDTGDNMMLTIMGGVDALTGNETTAAEASRKAADGMLLSARGNSGVILSQLFEGIAEGLENVDAADNNQLALAMQCGVKHAYSAVMEPTEGTILTVARNAGEYASGRKTESPKEYLNDFLGEAQRTLERTPDMLPVLKQAEVVDSGGAGLVYIIEGMCMAIDGKIDPVEYSPAAKEGTQNINLDLFTEDSVLEYGYCTELLLRLQNAKTDPKSFDVSVITDYLQTIGESVVAFKNGSIVKLHVHTMTPDKVLSFCQRYGEFLKVKIENMSLQHNNISVESVDVSKPASVTKKYGIVAVCAGEGVKRLFFERGADAVVDGGQSMNPSTEDFLTAFERVNAKNILVLPNNGNIILAAKQAANLYHDADVYVLESKNIGDGYAALSMFDPDAENAGQLVSDLTDAMKGVVTAMISRSIRDADMRGTFVHAGDYMGFADDKEILAAAPVRLDAAYATVDRLDFSRFEICILIRGAKADKKEADAICEYIRGRYQGTEVYPVDGLQDIYDYIMILE